MPPILNCLIRVAGKYTETLIKVEAGQFWGMKGYLNVLLCISLLGLFMIRMN